MFEFIFIVGSTVWGYRKLKKYLAQIKSESRNNFSTYGDTVTIQEFEEVKEENLETEDEIEDNIEELKELRKTIKKKIKSKVEEENLEGAMSLLSYLEEIIEKIEELEKADQTKFLAIKAKNLSKKIINKLEKYI